MSSTELGDRLIHVRSRVKHEKDFPSFTEDDIVFIFGDIVRPVEFIINKNDPLVFCVVPSCSTNAGCYWFA